MVTLKQGSLSYEKEDKIVTFFIGRRNGMENKASHTLDNGKNSFILKIFYY